MTAGPSTVGPGEHCNRRVVAVLAAAVLAAVAAPVASAHVGELKTVVKAGPYRLVVRALPIQAGTQSALTFRASITDSLTGAAVSGARVRVLVRAPAGTISGPYRTAAVGGTYSVLLPISNPDTWRQLRFLIEVDGPLGGATGRYAPPSLFTQWLFEPWILAGAAIAAALFVQGFVRLRRRGRRDHASWRRLVLFTVGLCLMVLPLLSPLDIVGDHFLLSAHMLQHVLIGDAAPALLLVAVRGPLLYFAVPKPLLRAFGRSVSLRRAVTWLVRPKVALAIWAAAYGGWHLPVAYDYAAKHQAVHDLEHASFVLAGFLVWSLLIDPARHGHLSRGRRLGVAAALFAMGTVISDVLIFSFHPLYPAYAHQAERVFSLSPIRDQQFAGLVMTVDQLLTLGTCTAILLWPALRDLRRYRAPLVTQGQPA